MNKSSKIYIASPFFNEQQLNEVKQIEKICEKCHYRYFSPRKSQSTNFVKSLKQEDWLFELGKKFFFLDDIKELDSCDTIIVNPNNYDSGTLFELGYAIVKNKLILPSHQKYDEYIKDVLKISSKPKSSYYNYDNLLYVDDTYHCCIFAETKDMEYKGISKVFLGIMYAKGIQIDYYDIPRKSNIMLTSACSVHECKNEDDLKLLRDTLFNKGYDSFIRISKEVKTTFVTGRIDD